MTEKRPARLDGDAAVRSWRSTKACHRRPLSNRHREPYARSKGRNGARHSFELPAKLKLAFDRFRGALRAASEPARETFVEQRRVEIMALASEQLIPGASSAAGDAAVPTAPTGACADGGYHGNR
jgi:hypothetical protein